MNERKLSLLNSKLESVHPQPKISDHIFYLPFFFLLDFNSNKWEKVKEQKKIIERGSSDNTTSCHMKRSNDVLFQSVIGCNLSNPSHEIPGNFLTFLAVAASALILGTFYIYI